MFWQRMTLTGLGLGSLAVVTSAPARRSGIRLWHVPLGLLSAAVLYVTFQIGERFARRFVPGGDKDIREIYALRTLQPKEEIAARLATIIGPAEELFWRGLVQTALMRRFGRWPGAALAAGAYMQKLADTYWTTIKTLTLDKGATHVAILNMPDITLTPRFAGVMAQVAAASGGGSAGAAAAAALKAAVQQREQAFNARLATDINGDARVALVPFYEDFNDEVAHPATYALANVTTPVCAETGFPSTCVDSTLSANPPAGASANWWTDYLFSNNFHPTPYGHQLLANTVTRALARGWF